MPTIYEASDIPTGSGYWSTGGISNYPNIDSFEPPIDPEIDDEDINIEEIINYAIEDVSLENNVLTKVNEGDILEKGMKVVLCRDIGDLRDGTVLIVQSCSSANNNPGNSILLRVDTKSKGLGGKTYRIPYNYLLYHGITLENLEEQKILYIKRLEDIEKKIEFIRKEPEGTKVLNEKKFRISKILEEIKNKKLNKKQLSELILSISD